MSRSVFLVVFFLFCVPGLRAEAPPAAPPELMIYDREGMTPEIYRGSMRYLDALVEAKGADCLFLFPGRSLTFLSILGEAHGLATLTLPGSALTDLSPQSWNDPKLAPKLLLYQELVTQDLKEALKGGKQKKVVIADTGDTGNSILFMRDLIKRIADSGKVPGLKPAMVDGVYIPVPGLRSEAVERLKKEGVDALTLDFSAAKKGTPQYEAANQMKVDDFYFHQQFASQMAGQGASVLRFDPREVEPTDKVSVEAYRVRYRDRSNPVHKILKDYMGRLEKLFPVVPLYAAPWRKAPPPLLPGSCNSNYADIAA
ncbi:MAG: hypothetical protein KDD51_12250 [Bdellovibrionales bacterium]|nr:hypothetical protein [Bdellovibrionales bacterium]